MSVDALNALLGDCVTFYRRVRAREESSEEEDSNSEDRMPEERRDEHQQIVSDETVVKYGVMVNEETTEEKAEVGRMEIERRNETEVTEPEEDLDLGRNVEVTELGIEDGGRGEEMQRDSEGRTEMLEMSDGKEQDVNEEERNDIEEEESEKENVGARTMKGKEKKKKSKGKEKRELSKKRKRMFEECIKQASNGQLGES